MSQSFPFIPVAGNRPAFVLRALVSLAGGALLGAVIAALSPGSFWNGWLAAGLLSALSLFALISAWTWAVKDPAVNRRLLAWLIIAAFALRLLTGVGLSLALPVYGYDQDCQKAGYLFKDACARDREAFSIANTGAGLFWFSGIQLGSDQYGGLAFLSGWVYRYLSPDAHLPFLILILGAAFAALGVPFFYRALLLRWPARVAVLAAWIYTLYPDAVYFGASQMREPFLVGLSGIAFWAVCSWEQNLRRGLLVFILAVAGMVFFSFRVAFIMAGVLAVWFWLDYSFNRAGKRWTVLGWLGLATGILAMALFTWGWFRSSAGYDIRVTMQNSGMAQQQFKAFGERYIVPLVAAYGIAQPVLPAAIVEVTALPLAKGISIVRALGWYALAPFLLYGFFSVWREPGGRRKRALLWLAFAVAFWLVIVSLRGGGDATDNPRYRSLFIIWMALLAAWVIDWSLARKDAWLWRWVLVEAIFLGFFTHWYLGRNFKFWIKMPFWTMVIWIIGLSGLVLIGGWVWDRSRLRAGKPENPAR